MKQLHVYLWSMEFLVSVEQDMKYFLLCINVLATFKYNFETIFLKDCIQISIGTWEFSAKLS